MNIDIRENIRNNFKEADASDIKASIESSIEQKEEITLPGLGVFFEILWNECEEDLKQVILDKIKKGI